MKSSRISDLLRSRQNLITFVICAAGIGLNLFLSSVVSALGLSLYLDTVGTVAVAAIGGYLPGVIVGFLTNNIRSFSEPSSMYYSALNVLIAVCAARLAKKGWFKKPLKIAGIIVIFTLIGGGFGALIPWFMDGLSFDSESLSGILYETGLFNIEVSHILSSIITDIPDKIITVLIVLLIMRLIPQKYYKYFGFKGWKQTPVSEDELTTNDRMQVRVLSLRSKIILVLGISLVMVAAVATGVSITVFQKSITKEHTQIAQGTANIAAYVLDGDKIDGYMENGGDSASYRETKKLLQEILYSSTEIAYLYVYQIKQDGCHVVFDIETEGQSAEKIGTILPFDDGFGPQLDALLAGEEIEPVITNDRYGHLLTAYKPVYDSSGRCVCYVGADVAMSQLTAMERSFFVEMISIFLGFFILVCALAIWLTEYHVIFPIRTITRCLDRFSKAGVTQKNMDEDVRNIRSINICTGDEIEKLYQSLCRLTLRQTEQMRNIRHLSESTARMQDGLIITMADMVENRDSDTGAHIQKTAAYVKIIVEGLQKKGYYTEKITPKFISDVIRSAPLHDVGKINIPDGILNKPGKLTPEEYEIMKTHTTAGKRIMEDAISSVEGENYLKEARNMAAYHHERWDGSGYPENLHGEVIPLSARIMAVADVFDALTSPRIYKPAFPLDEALAIIEEGKGTQFDPKCVEVFMDSLPEVKVILKKYN